MVKKILIMATVMILGPWSTWASSWQQGEESIRITRSERGFKFEYCGPNLIQCETLGPKEFYRSQELSSNAFKEFLKGSGLMLATAGAIVGTGVYVSITVGLGTLIDAALMSLSYSTGMSPLASYYTLIGGSVTGTAGLLGLTSKAFKSFNPRQHFNASTHLYESLQSKDQQIANLDEVRDILEQALNDL